ncbi:hypothetical protein BST65_02105 [Bradyrhizobium canariense]|jgi:hypothetical protein|uniref:Uncharacterized protein n=1 Tax=Bradyrhizobium betae TaxID=244734 RepID=A0A4Q1UFM8_9BRAD|nr:hypothetical protein BST65_02105 [Bradyrhizobium canariense]RXT33281.1 hypothetical protein B5V03_40140 [Bradyrhizobium betae]OSI37333.1 hypothetical protein BST66_03525 [Bradyrhizobium canariense]OSI52189.1 hypothetical protein BSZ20_04000 [Bradyrhizobium canariense]OSI56367.1 hypothetical protein BST67_03490 [Bradyrhizobium canariense]
MNLTTIGIAILLVVPSEVALAEGTLNYNLPTVRPVVRGVTILAPGRSGFRTFPPGIRSPAYVTPGGVRIYRDDSVPGGLRTDHDDPPSYNDPSKFGGG